MAKNRRRAREAALRALYQMEIARMRTVDAVNNLKEHSELAPDLEKFAEQLVRGVSENQAYLDDKLASVVREWDFDRVAAVDRNLLRIAAYELYHCDDIPPIVSINEAIELAKKYSTADSGKFVNGVLARVLQDSPKSNWDPSEHVVEAEEPAPPEEQPEIEEITPEELESKELNRIGLWKIRAEDSKA